MKHLQQLAQILHEEEKDVRPNPVTQNVKIIMVSKLKFYISWSLNLLWNANSFAHWNQMNSGTNLQHLLKYFKFVFVVGWSFNGALSQPISCQQENHGYDGERRGQHSVQRARCFSLVLLHSKVFINQNPNTTCIICILIV